MFESWLFGHSVLIISYAVAIIGVAHMLRHRRSPGSTMAWLVTFVLLPLVGTALYLMFGGRKLRLQKRTPPRTTFESVHSLSAESTHPLATTLLRYGAAPAVDGNQVTVCKDGVAGYSTLVELIEQAQNSIHLVTFIFAKDTLGQEILRRLCDRARAGVEVKVLVDGLGSIRTPHSFFRELVRSGGHFAVFQPVVHLPFRTRTNLRNHRKILIADGARSFAGGMNITGADLYRERTRSGWRDLSLAIEGPAVQQLEAVFSQDWRIARGDTAVQPWVGKSLPRAGSDLVQVLASGPDVVNDPMYSSSLTAIYRALRRIWIVTPYFVPNDALVEALVYAAQRGVDVRILIPARSNHFLSDLAAAGLLRDIQAAGGTVLHYPKGMVHAKTMVVDDQFAAVGSANFDMRSLFLNYEVMQICYSLPTIEAVSNWFLELAEECADEPPESGFWRQLAEGAVRALSPMF